MSAGLAAVLAGLALFALGAMARLRDRIAAALAFAAAGALAALAAGAMGAADAALTLAAIVGFLAALAIATGLLIGEPAPAPRLGAWGGAWPGVGAATAAFIAVALAWGYAPPLPPGGAPNVAAVLDAPRAGDLFIALGVLVAVVGAAAALLGFGERGVLRDRGGPAS